MSFQDRVANITNGWFSESAVHDDGQIDYLTGNNGADWFLANTDGGVLDEVMDMTANETNSDVD